MMRNHPPALARILLQIFVGDAKLRNTLALIPDIQKANILTQDPLTTRFHVLKSARYNSPREISLQPDALYIHPVPLIRMG